MKNFLTIKNNNGAVTKIKKEHIIIVPYISKEIEIYTTSGRWEVIKKIACENFDEVLKELKDLNFLEIEREHEKIMIAENKISTVTITDNYISFYPSANGLPINFMKDDKCFEKAKKVAENLNFTTISKDETIIKLSPEAIEKVYQEMDRVIITTTSGNTYRELSKNIKWID